MKSQSPVINSFVCLLPSAQRIRLCFSHKDESNPYHSQYHCDLNNRCKIPICMVAVLLDFVCQLYIKIECFFTVVWHAPLLFCHYYVGKLKVVVYL